MNARVPCRRTPKTNGQVRSAGFSATRLIKEPTLSFISYLQVFWARPSARPPTGCGAGENKGQHSSWLKCSSLELH